MRKDNYNTTKSSSKLKYTSINKDQIIKNNIKYKEIINNKNSANICNITNYNTINNNDNNITSRYDFKDTVKDELSNIEKTNFKSNKIYRYCLSAANTPRLNAFTRYNNDSKVATRYKNKNSTSSLKTYVNKNDNSATYKFYHCNIFKNEKIKCFNCKKYNLHITIDNNKEYINCKGCNFKELNTSKKYVCNECNESFETILKKYDEEEENIIKEVIKYYLGEKKKVKPYFFIERSVYNCKCNCLLSSSIEFKHKYNCNGCLYKGDIDEESIIICSLCHYSILENWVKWCCPKCNISFTNNDTLTNSIDNKIKNKKCNVALDNNSNHINQSNCKNKIDKNKDLNITNNINNKNENSYNISSAYIPNLNKDKIYALKSKLKSKLKQKSNKSNSEISVNIGAINKTNNSKLSDSSNSKSRNTNINNNNDNNDNNDNNYVNNSNIDSNKNVKSSEIVIKKLHTIDEVHNSKSNSPNVDRIKRNVNNINDNNKTMLNDKLYITDINSSKQSNVLITFNNINELYDYINLSNCFDKKLKNIILEDTENIIKLLNNNNKYFEIKLNNDSSSNSNNSSIIIIKKEAYNKVKNKDKNNNNIIKEFLSECVEFVLTNKLEDTNKFNNSKLKSSITFIEDLSNSKEQMNNTTNSIKNYKSPEKINYSKSNNYIGDIFRYIKDDAIKEESETEENNEKDKNFESKTIKSSIVHKDSNFDINKCTNYSRYNSVKSLCFNSSKTFDNMLINTNNLSSKLTTTKFSKINETERDSFLYSKLNSSKSNCKLETENISLNKLENNSAIELIKDNSIHKEYISNTNSKNNNNNNSNKENNNIFLENYKSNITNEKSIINKSDLNNIEINSIFKFKNENTFEENALTDNIQILSKSPCMESEYNNKFIITSPYKKNLFLDSSQKSNNTGVFNYINSSNNKYKHNLNSSVDINNRINNNYNEYLINSDNYNSNSKIDFKTNVESSLKDSNFYSNRNNDDKTLLFEKMHLNQFYDKNSCNSIINNKTNLDKYKNIVTNDKLINKANSKNLCYNNNNKYSISSLKKVNVKSRPISVFNNKSNFKTQNNNILINNYNSNNFNNSCNNKSNIEKSDLLNINYIDSYQKNINNSSYIRKNAFSKVKNTSICKFPKNPFAENKEDNIIKNIPNNNKNNYNLDNDIKFKYNRSDKKIFSTSLIKNNMSNNLITNEIEHLNSIKKCNNYYLNTDSDLNYNTNKKDFNLINNSNVNLKSQNINININIEGLSNFNNNFKSKRNEDYLNLNFCNSKSDIKYNNTINENYSNNILNIDCFKIIKQVGEGTFAKIYQVEEISTKKIYALKKFICHSSEELKSLYREYELISNLKSKDNLNINSNNKYNNVLNLYGITSNKFDKTTFVLYILMENAICDWYREITNRITNKKYYKEIEIWNILNQLVSIFSQLQKDNIAHRDVKPQNILLFKGGVFKICDFGEAKSFNNLCLQNNEKLKNSINNDMNTIRGSELYMSPILFNSLKKNINKTKHNCFKSDVFSLGMSMLLCATLSFEILYELRKNANLNSVKEMIAENMKSNGYSYKLILFLFEMLKDNEEKRPDFIDLEEYLINKSCLNNNNIN